MIVYYTFICVYKYLTGAHRKIKLVINLDSESSGQKVHYIHVSLFIQCLKKLIKCFVLLHCFNYSGLKNHCNVWLFCIACDVKLDCMGITLSADRVD